MSHVSWLSDQICIYMLKLRFRPRGSQITDATPSPLGYPAAPSLQTLMDMERMLLSACTYIYEMTIIFLKYVNKHNITKTVVAYGTTRHQRLNPIYSRGGVIITLY